MKGGLPSDFDISAHSPEANLSHHHQSPDPDVFLVNYLANITLPQLMLSISHQYIA